MNQLTRGTTPTITFTFSNVDITSMNVAYLTIKQSKNVIEYDLESAVLDTENNSLAWTLTQADTLLLSPNLKVAIQVRYKLNDDTAGASQVYQVDAYKILKDGEI